MILDGSASFDVDISASGDADSDMLTYRWSFLLNPSAGATLSDATVVNPSFNIDELGPYVLQLIVNDGTVDSDPNTVTSQRIKRRFMANAVLPANNPVADVSTFPSFSACRKGWSVLNVVSTF